MLVDVAHRPGVRSSRGSSRRGDGDRRHRHDVAQTIQRFSARLRQQVDLDTLTAELLAVVDQTMQPTQVSLWLVRSLQPRPWS
jgi:hypothetical protein